MKLLRIAAMICAATLLFTVCGCGKTLDSVATQNTHHSSNGYEPYPQYGDLARYRCGENGVYHLQCAEHIQPNGVYGEYIYYSPDGVNNYAPLCSKRGCFHNSSLCDASVYGTSAFGMWDNKIFYISTHSIPIKICSLSLDTAERQELFELEMQNGLAYQFYFHRQYLYITTYCESGGNDALLCYELKENSSAKEIKLDGIAHLAALVPYNDLIFFRGTNTYGIDGLYRYCTTDQTLQLITNEPYNAPYFEGDKVYYLLHESSKLTPGFYEWDAVTKESTLMREFAPRTALREILYCEKYIFVAEYGNDVEEPYFYIFNREYALVNLFPNPTKDLLSHPELFGFANGYLLIGGGNSSDFDAQYFLREDEFEAHPKLYTIENYIV